MRDDFYEQAFHSLPSSKSPTGQGLGLLSDVSRCLLLAPAGLLLFVIFIPVVVAVATRILSGRPSKRISDKNARSIAVLPYWFPFIGHSISFLYDRCALMDQARKGNPHGAFALNFGATTHNVFTDPDLVKSVFAQDESDLQMKTIGWNAVQRFLGFPKEAKSKYDDAWKDLMSLSTEYLMQEPHLGILLRRVVRGLEHNIPQMISFIDTEIDLQPWERSGKATFISPTEMDINLKSVMRDMMGYASVPAVFGSALMNKYPDILLDLYDMDSGIYFFKLILPAWIPWPGVMKAHLARFRLWQAMNDFQRALDATVDGRPVDSSWGDFDDTSQLILRRHAYFKEHTFDISEREDISILWALVVNSNMLVYWQILYILSTPGLLDRLRTEITPYAKVLKPISIGNISEAPRLVLCHQNLSNKCPLLKATYFETLRLTNHSWSARRAARDVLISGNPTADSGTFVVRKGEHVMIPHDLQVGDLQDFSEPDRFIPERFIVQNEDGTVTTDIRTMRPYGGGESICTGRALAEAKCLSLVAGVLAFWDIEPADKNTGWIIPTQMKTSAVSRPVSDTRVRIKRRQFEWEQ